MNDVKTNEKVDKRSLAEEIQNQPYKVPLVNITENDNHFVISADMPGVSKENIELKVEDNNLTLIGKVDFNSNTESKFILREKRVGNYIRKFKLGDSINQDEIKAKLENGQLTLNLPKKESIKPRSIEIN